MVGMTRHSDSVEYGLAEPVFVMAADYDDRKRLNMVLSRPVHYPQHEYILDYCDRNGILLVPEIPAWQIDVSHMANPDVLATAKQQLEEMILTDYNHPSVWAWSVANEISSDTPQGKSFVQELVALAKELDPTRPVGFASFKLAYQPQRDATDWLDFVMMNGYAGSWHMPKRELGPALDRIHETWPDKAVIISEFGIDAHWNISSWSRPGEELDPQEYYFVPDDTPAYSDEVYAMRSQVLRDQTTLAPADTWSGEVGWDVPESDYVLTLSIFRPTGFGVIERSYNSRGELLPADGPG
jgi:hypothetical protein